MKRPLTVQALSGLLNVISCLVAILFILYLNPHFGREDIFAVVFWTVPIAMTLAITGSSILSLLKFENSAIRILFLVTIAATLSYLWVHFVYLFDGNWTHAFTFPIFYLWLISSTLQLIFLDQLKMRTHDLGGLALVIFPFVLFFSTLITYAISTAWIFATRHEKETFIIPENFSGTFRIVYGDRCGVEPRIENDARVLEIPQDGILSITSNFKTGIVDHQYFVQTSDGQLTELRSISNPDSIGAGGVWLKETGILPGIMADGTMSVKSSLAVHYTDFVVFKPYQALVLNDVDLNQRTADMIQPCQLSHSAYKTAAYRRPIYYFKMR